MTDTHHVTRSARRRLKRARARVAHDAKQRRQQAIRQRVPGDRP